MVFVAPPRFKSFLNMETKLPKKNKLAIIPAGIIEGTEPFWFDNEKWVIHEYEIMRYHESPGSVQRMIANAFMNDKKSRSYLKKIGVVGFTEAFEWWYKCVIGGLDHIPDFLNGKFTPDAYNNLCTDYDCPHRGRFCSLATGLKSHEVKTIRELKKGKSIAATASDLHVSTAGIKSRVENIKVKLETPNMASMMAKAAELGI